MTVVGVSGHQELPEQAVAHAKHELLRLVPERQWSLEALSGVSSLAAGADQLFAEHVLRVGGDLRVVIPCEDYLKTFQSASDRRRYRALLEQAVRVDTLPFPEPSEEAFFVAGKAVVEASDWLIAIWDGERARGLGGTADVVDYATELGRRVEVVWPDGVTR